MYKSEIWGAHRPPSSTVFCLVATYDNTTTYNLCPRKDQSECINNFVHNTENVYNALQEVVMCMQKEKLYLLHHAIKFSYDTV